MNHKPKKFGITFTEAQEKIFEFGTETEKANVLVEAITAKVGGMNEALAKTDVGRQKQLDNWLGDVKEKDAPMGASLIICVIVNYSM